MEGVLAGPPPPMTLIRNPPERLLCLGGPLRRERCKGDAALRAAYTGQRLRRPWRVRESRVHSEFDCNLHNK